MLAASAVATDSPAALIDLTRYPILDLAAMHDGDELYWHYDQTDFVMSLALQDADA